jgi:hypothetical protein
MALPTAGDVSGPGAPGAPHPHVTHRRALALKRVEAWAPVRTAPP